MKKSERKYRFYIWDYLWWLGEKEHEKYGGRMDGPMMFMFYYYILTLVPLELLLRGYLSDRFIFFVYVLVGFLFLLWMLWLHKFVYTKERRKAVMEHFSSKRHKSLQTYFFCLLPFLIAVFIVVFTDMTINNHNKPAPQIAPEAEIENIHTLRKLIKADSALIRQPRRFRNNGEQ